MLRLSRLALWLALQVSSASWFMALWVLGGLAALCGALTYAELASRYPNIGGEFHFLTLAYGRNLGFLFVWARLSVMQTGALATVAFVFGDYAQNILPLGSAGSALWAGLAILVLTLFNLAGLSNARRVQLFMESLALAAVVIVILAGLFFVSSPELGGQALQSAPAGKSIENTTDSLNALGLGLVFVLLTYGGWNEAAYLSAEVKDARRAMVRALLLGTGLVMLLYIAINLAYLNALGLDGLRASKTPAASVVGLAFGPVGEHLLTLGIAIAALSTLNVTLLTGGRALCAMGQTSPVLARLGQWDRDNSVPRNALILQAVISLALVAFGATTADGFSAMIAFSAPAFWLFLLLTGLSLFLLRRHPHKAASSYTVPLYPLVPALFCTICAYMLWSSLGYVSFVFGSGETQRLSGLLGMGVLGLGVPVLIWVRLRERRLERFPGKF
jgi:basic amino acid/polyamine antiporter, APA family